MILFFLLITTMSFHGYDCYFPSGVSHYYYLD